MGLSRMLRTYILQQVMGFSDKGTKDAVYDSPAIQLFMGIDLGRDAVPDATTLLRFRQLLETHGLTQQIFAAVNYQLVTQGLYLKEGMVVDASSGLVHTMVTTPANAHDATQAHALYPPYS